VSFANQYLFQLGNKETYLEDDYILGSANVEAFELLKHYHLLDDVGYGRMVFLNGAANSGKTHLANIWQSNTGALKILEKDFYNDNYIEKIKSRKFLIIEDIEKLKIFEKKLFFMINRVLENKAYLLVTSCKTPHNLNFDLLDLVSRLKAFNYVAIKDPDLELLRGVFLKLLIDRQLKVSLEILNFIMQRIERTFQAIAEIVNKLDQLSLSTKRNITIPFINEHFSFLNLK